MITLLKLGGSVITDKSKPYTARGDEILRLCKEVKAALAEDRDLRLIIGNGGGSFPHQPAEKGQLKHGIKEAWQLEHMLETHRAASELNHMLVSSLVKSGVPAITVKPSSAAYSDNDKIVDFNVLLFDELLKLRAVPVIHGDVLVDIKKGCSIASTETLFSYLANTLPVKRIVIGTNVDGVLDSDGCVISEIDPRNFTAVKKHLGASGHTDVTGGMLHKVESMLELAKMGHQVVITNALTPGNIKKTLLGENIGTLIRG
jgi:isopentenyl phosphate kinase